MDDRYFCMAPWTHIQQNSYGEINPCCMFYGKDKVYTKKYDSLQDAFDGSENAKLRNRMLNGEYIDSCKKCYRDEDLGKSSYRQRFNDRYNLNEMPAIRELELALSNKCNFKCVTCNTRFSSSWYDEDKLLERTQFTNIGRYYKSSFNVHDIDLSQLTELKILGGEPFLEKDLLNVFKNINKKNVTLFFVTNNSIFPSDEWLNQFKQFKKVRFIISLDGVNDVAEFVRYGKKFKKFEKNYSNWIQLSKTDLTNIKVIPHFVFHALNCFDLNNTLEWMTQYHDNLKILSYDFLESPNELSVKYLPNDVKTKILSENNNFLHDQIENFLKMSKYDKEVYNKLKKYCKFLNLRTDLPDICKQVLG